MKKNFKIRKRKDFLRASGSGIFFRADFFIVQIGFNNLETYRVGFTASKKVGNAVIRNRCKRRMRAAADLIISKSGLSGIDYVFIAKKSTASVPWNIFLDKISDAIKILNKKIESNRKF